MMQISHDAYCGNKHSLLNVMNRFIAAPSLPSKQRDMYEHYLLLKSIKNEMEWGLLKREMSGGASFLEMAVKQEEQQVTAGPADDCSDLESQFHFHLRGLFGVLSKLTVQADHLTNRYKREIGGGSLLR
uniref:MID1 interacting protein 1, like n=1 Tax=Electrophorus electricus TaxID=8005 RepID=A0AAY5EXA0_ELEEL